MASRTECFQGQNRWEISNIKRCQERRQAREAETDIKDECATQFESHNLLSSFQNWATSHTQSPLKRGDVLMRKGLTTPRSLYIVVMPQASSKRTYHIYLGNNALEKVEHPAFLWPLGHRAELTLMQGFIRAPCQSRSLWGSATLCTGSTCWPFPPFLQALNSKTT